MASRLLRPRHLRSRVLAGVLAVTAVSFVAFDVGAVFELRGYLLARTDASLQTALTVSKPRVARLVRQAQVGIPAPLLQAVAGLGGYDYAAFVPTHGKTIVLDTAGQTPQLPRDLTALAAMGTARTVPGQHGEQLRLRAEEADGGILVVTAGLNDVNHTVGQLELIVIVGSLVAIAPLTVGVAIVMRRGLRPLEKMAVQADRISAGDLDRRVQVPDAANELGRLGLALNEMLARIERFMAEQQSSKELMRRFLADASHELRTPIASVRANAELYQQGALTEPNQIDEAMRRIALESERMGRLVDDMLALVRFEQHPQQGWNSVDLSAVVMTSLERARLADPRRTWREAIEEGLMATGDAELLSRAVDNLLTNVRTHTPTETTSSVGVRREGAWLVVEVTDDGPGVPPDAVPHLFERFFRVGGRSARPGSGLGLAIVADIVNSHRGVVEAVSNQPKGLGVSFSLPDAGQGDVIRREIGVAEPYCAG